MTKPAIIEIRRTGSPKWQMRVLDAQGAELDATFASTRRSAWRMATASWRHLDREHLDGKTNG